MPTATRARSSAPAQTVEPADFDRVISYITTEVLVERDLEMRVLVRGALAGVNIHMIGEPRSEERRVGKEC